MRTMSRMARERAQRRVLFTSIGVAAGLVLLVIGYGLYRELIGFPNEVVARVFAEQVTLRDYRDSLATEMQRLQTQSGSTLRNQQNPGAASSEIQRLINAQETLPEDVLENEIEKAIIRNEVKARGIRVSDAEIDRKINELLSVQRDVLNQPTATPTATSTPRPTATPTPEGFEPTPTRTPTPSSTPTPTVNPSFTATPLGSPTATPTETPTPTPSPTVDPNASPTPTSTPRPTRTPAFTATIPPTLLPEEFDKAYADLKGVLKNEGQYRAGIEDQLLREKLRDAIGAAAPTSGPRARVQRLVMSTIDEAKVALIALKGGFSTFEELVDQASDRNIEGRESGDLGWVAKGAEMQGFDDVVFTLNAPLGEWTEPFAAGHHFEIVRVLEREQNAQYDQKNIDKIKERLFADWLAEAKQSAQIMRELSPQERAWAVDRASKGIFLTETPRR
jgi:parvulin-like peptidyl-prolyl isomerase